MGYLLRARHLKLGVALAMPGLGTETHSIYLAQFWCAGAPMSKRKPGIESGAFIR